MEMKENFNLDEFVKAPPELSVRVSQSPRFTKSATVLNLAPLRQQIFDYRISFYTKL
jgi:hypothetical protein